MAHFSQLTDSWMVVGATSNAGKSLLCTAMCRSWQRQGCVVAPFKGQNMALNSYVVEGGEIGYAQAVQAWSAGTIPSVAMNPILLKPQGNSTSQVILQGQVAGVTDAEDYYRNYFQRGWQAITASLQELGDRYSVLICEGAGSPAEVNLKHRDLTNMRVAHYLQAKTILIVNIDPGGAFAHVVGTLALLSPQEKSLIKGIVINKFRGKRSILQPGIDWLEAYTRIPVLGVLPYLDIALPAEDSLALLDRRSRYIPTDLEVAVIRLPRIANFTDFDPLLAENTVSLRWVTPKEVLGKPDCVILPGSKTTIADLRILQETGMAQQLHSYRSEGGIIMGICGGMQMMGSTIEDPEGWEGFPGKYQGLGFLPLETVFTQEKILQKRTVQGTTSFFGQGPLQGYEMHQGRSVWHSNTDWIPLCNDRELGVISATGEIMGTYLHGIFDNGVWRRSWLNFLRDRRGLPLLPRDVPDYSIQRNLLFDQLADAIEEHLNFSKVGR